MLKYNKRERDVQEAAIANGWKVLYKGYPDFLCYKDGKKFEAFFLEIKRKPYRYAKGKAIQHKTYDVNLSPEQVEMHRVLKRLGLKVVVVHRD